MKYVDQLQTLSREDASKLIYAKLSSLALDALTTKNESTVSEAYSVHTYGADTPSKGKKNIPFKVDAKSSKEAVEAAKKERPKSNLYMVVKNGKVEKSNESTLTEASKKVNGEYSEHNPKVDLYVDGKYQHSTNWADTAKNAIANAETKFPHLKGKFTASIAKKNGTNESVVTDEEYQEEDTTNEIAEGVRKVGEYENGEHKATIHKDSDLAEYKVKFYKNNKHHEPADYFTDDLKDAQGTAKAQVDKLQTKHSTLSVKEDVDMGQADSSLRKQPEKDQKKMSWMIALNHAAKKMGHNHFMDIPNDTPEDEELRKLARHIQINGKD